MRRKTIRGLVAASSTIALGCAFGWAFSGAFGTRAAMAADKDAPADRPWMNAALSPDERAKLLERAMTPEEKIGLLHGKLGTPFRGEPMPDGAAGSAGYIPAIPRLGV